jgi:hypothetical protein
LKLLDLILENFISSEEQMKLRKRVQFSQEADEWIIGSNDDNLIAQTKSESALGQHIIIKFID